MTHFVDDIEELFRPGTIVSERFRIHRLLNRGAVGAVYLADDLLLNQLVAVKVIHSECMPERETIVRFMREVAVTRLINHPNIVRTYDCGRYHNHLFYSMEYVEGEALSQLISRGDQIPLSHLADLVVQILDGLNAIHNANVIHRDLKPSNILIDGTDRVRIMDFGLARIERSDLTGENVIIGTLEYMSPEQINAGSLSPSSDLYSLGIIIYELFCNETPFYDKSLANIAYKQCTEAPPPLRNRCADAPVCFEVLVRWLLQKNAADRPQSAREVSSWLKHELNE